MIPAMDIRYVLADGTLTYEGLALLEDLAGSGGASWGGITGTLSAQTDLQAALTGKQATLVSGTNIKTINGASVLGSGDLVVSSGASPILAWMI